MEFDIENIEAEFSFAQCNIGCNANSYWDTEGKFRLLQQIIQILK